MCWCFLCIQGVLAQEAQQVEHNEECILLMKKSGQTSSDAGLRYGVKSLLRVASTNALTGCFQRADRTKHA